MTDTKPRSTCPDGATKRNCALNNLNQTQLKDSYGNIYLVPDLGVDPMSPQDICDWCKAQYLKKLQQQRG